MFNAVEQQGQQTCSHTDEHAEHNGRRSEPTKAFDSNRWLHVNLRTLCNEYALGTPLSLATLDSSLKEGSQWNNTSLRIERARNHETRFRA